MFRLLYLMVIYIFLIQVYGACLEVLYKDQLDRAFIVFRNSSQDEEKLDYQSRLHLLELIELRANQWKGTDVMSQYYKKKITHEVRIKMKIYFKLVLLFGIL